MTDRTTTELAVSDRELAEAAAVNHLDLRELEREEADWRFSFREGRTPTTAELDSEVLDRSHRPLYWTHYAELAELEAEKLAELAELADSEAFYAADKLSAERRWFAEGESRETELLAIIESLGHKVEKDLQSPPEWAAFKGAEAELKALSRFLRTMRSRGG